MRKNKESIKEIKNVDDEKAGINSPAAMNASTVKPVTSAKNPIKENTIKPQKILVAAFRQHSAMQSLQHTKNNNNKGKKEV